MKLLGIITDFNDSGDLILSNTPDDLLEVNIPCTVSIGYSNNTSKLYNLDNLEITRKKMVIKVSPKEKQIELNAEMGVWIDEQCLVFKSSDGFFISDLIGCKVFDSDSNFIGSLKDVYLLPANDVWIVNTEKGELPVPVVDEFVSLVDIKNKKIVINILDGLMDLIQ